MISSSFCLFFSFYRTSNETTCHILKTKLKEYSTVVDKPDGINNFANGVIDLVPHGINGEFIRDKSITKDIQICKRLLYGSL